MNLDLSIHRMAFREAQSLGEAQVLVAKKHAELERELILKQANEGDTKTGVLVDSIVAAMQRQSDQVVHASRPDNVDLLV